MQSRVKGYIDKINANSSLFGLDWEIFSGALNRELRNAIICASTEEQTAYKLTFGYWQIVNKIKNADKKELVELRKVKRSIESELNKIVVK